MVEHMAYQQSSIVHRFIERLSIFGKLSASSANFCDEYTLIRLSRDSHGLPDLSATIYSYETIWSTI